MKNTIKIVALALAVSLTGCNNKQSLQEYIVEKQEQPNFLVVDLPSSVASIAQDSLTVEEQDALNSVKKLNFIGYKINETSKQEYQTELDKVKSILEDKQYQELMEFSSNGMKIDVRYVGEDDSAEEFIVFGNKDDLGFGVVRLLGNDMKPEKMVALMQSMQHSNMDTKQLAGIAGFFK